jgi:hypothetical protein
MLGSRASSRPTGGTQRLGSRRRCATFESRDPGWVLSCSGRRSLLGDLNDATQADERLFIVNLREGALTA